MGSKRHYRMLTIRRRSAERGQTPRDWGTQMESAALENIVKEFWPDIRQKVFQRK